jgi:endo-1,4-beta-D-glucanase Y
MYNVDIFHLAEAVMKTAEQREKQFREELHRLLTRHGATIVVTDDGKPYGMHSAVCRIEMDDEDSGDLLAEPCDFEI